MKPTRSRATAVTATVLRSPHRRKRAVALRQACLRLPCCFSGGLRQMPRCELFFLPHCRRIAVGPCALGQHPLHPCVAGLGDAAAPNAVASRSLGGYRSPRSVIPAHPAQRLGSGRPAGTSGFGESVPAPEPTTRRNDSGLRAPVPFRVRRLWHFPPASHFLRHSRPFLRIMRAALDASVGVHSCSLTYAAP